MTVNDLIEELKKFPPDMKIGNRFKIYKHLVHDHGDHFRYHHGGELRTFGCCMIAKQCNAKVEPIEVIEIRGN